MPVSLPSVPKFLEHARDSQNVSVLGKIASSPAMNTPALRHPRAHLAFDNVSFNSVSRTRNENDRGSSTRLVASLPAKKETHSVLIRVIGDY